MEKRRDDRLLHFPETQPDRVPLDVARTLEFALDDPCPRLPFAFMLLRVGDRDQLAHGLGESILARFGEKHTRADQGARVPFLRLAQGQREGP